MISSDKQDAIGKDVDIHTVFSKQFDQPCQAARSVVLEQGMPCGFEHEPVAKIACTPKALVGTVTAEMTCNRPSPGSQAVPQKTAAPHHAGQILSFIAPARSNCKS